MIFVTGQQSALFRQPHLCILHTLGAYIFTVGPSIVLVTLCLHAAVAAFATQHKTIVRDMVRMKKGKRYGNLAVVYFLFKLTKTLTLRSDSGLDSLIETN